MIKRHKILGLTISVRETSSKDFRRKTTNLIDGGYSIVREDGEITPLSEVRYSIYSGNRCLSYIHGHFEDDETFRIDRIENVTRKSKNKVPGSKTLPLILEELESDLKEKGISTITTHTLMALAPIIVQRYDFEDCKGRNYE